MDRAALACVSVAFLAPLLLGQTKPNITERVFRSPGSGRAEILQLGETGESRVEFYSSGGDHLCSADYSSADGTHGLVVAKAEWTPDKRYFVFSMQSSSGHQPWHAPTSFYTSDDHMLCSLDDFLDPPGIATTDFTLAAPNQITTVIYGKQMPASTPLDRITKTGTRNGKPRCVPCENSAVYRFGETSK